MKDRGILFASVVATFFVLVATAIFLGLYLVSDYLSIADVIGWLVFTIAASAVVIIKVLKLWD